MKKFLLPALFSLLLSGCTLNQAAQTTPPSTTQPNTQSDQSMANNITGSLEDLINQSKSLKCTWQYTDPQNQSQGQGEIFVSGKKFSGSTTIQVPGQNPITSEMISDGQWLYQWGGPLAQGVKMNISELQDMGSDQTNDQAQSAYKTLNQQYQYHCQAWTPDQSKFQLPSGVKFTDLTQLMQNAVENSQDMQQNACAMCDLLPADAKTECLKSCQ